MELRIFIPLEPSIFHPLRGYENYEVGEYQFWGRVMEGQKALAFQRRIKTKEETLDCLFADMVPTRYIGKSVIKNVLEIISF